MDDIDRRVVALLQQDARRSYDSIGREVSLSAPAVKRRVDRLRASGAIRGFTTVVDHAALGASTEALVELFYAPGTRLERVADHLTSEVVFAAPDWPLERAAAEMVSGGFRHLIVCEGADVLGVLSVRDVVRVWTQDGATSDVAAA